MVLDGTLMSIKPQSITAMALRNLLAIIDTTDISKLHESLVVLRRPEISHPGMY